MEQMHAKTLNVWVKQVFKVFLKGDSYSQRTDLKRHSPHDTCLNKLLTN